jgi:hypothetical protein
MQAENHGMHKIHAKSEEGGGRFQGYSDDLLSRGYRGRDKLRKEHARLIAEVARGSKSNANQQI